MNNNNNTDIAHKYGKYASFKTSPSLIEYYGQNPEEEIDRLLNIYSTSDSTILDLGCGAGHTMCKFSPKVKEFWGIDVNEELLNYTKNVANENNFNNVRLILGNTASINDTNNIPNDYFDIALSQRGPNMQSELVKKLKNNGIFIQEYVSGFDCYPLREIFGRTNYSPYNLYDSELLLCSYAELELFPVSIKQYFYDEYFADIEHLESYLCQGADLSNWRLPSKPYNHTVDRVSLELYVKYNTTPKGIKLMHQRKILILRKTKVNYYPIDSIQSEL